MDASAANCGRCGTRLYGERAGRSTANVRAGTLDDISDLRPVGHIWTRSRQPWVEIPEGALAFETQPDDFVVFVAAARG